ncbi:uncharacterized protein RHOBADRAFT_56546 [Rhodotorula graminis WP1]|uniref:Uncharacterized protein n=1 Tax=Rhodotorula graminis (strain WP1) TaxID=578459 RepID=A0A0P9EWL5_RHOGW|nr:uncharacterized protein RHOBADRAFT_56546 [Rhodotorula graminis WP1]KPV71503.1 hypothetical protein RHOBADRAFT_56546 [Rhodotorula graminis WP1]
MVQEQLDDSTAPSRPDVHSDERSGRSDGPDPGPAADPSPAADKQLGAILNASEPPNAPPQAPREPDEAPEPTRPRPDDEQHRLARPAAPEPAPAAPSPVQSVLVGQPPLSLDIPPPVHPPPQPPRLPVAKLLFTTLAPSVHLSIRDMCDFVRDFPNAEHINIQSGRAVSTSYNAQEPNLRAQLWVDWHIFSTLARALGVPVFPIQPAKVALVLATYAEMPLSPVLRQIAHLTSPHDTFAIPNVFEALNLAAKATRHLWTDVACFVRSADNYEATAVLHAHVNEVARTSFYARTGQAYYGRPPLAYPYQRMHHPPLPPRQSQDPVSTRPLLTHVPPAAPAPSLVTPPPDQFIQPAHGEAKQADSSLRSLCEDLPGLLNDMQKETDDLATFELAQERFQATVNTVDFASRVARLHHTAVIYTHVTALLRFPTYPITSRKLAVFALAMTPGPLGVKLDEAVPYLDESRQCPRAPKGKTLEDILTDLTLVRRITFGNHVSGEENSQWARWWKEVTDDWKGKGKNKSKLRDEQPVVPAAKRIKRSVSPDSDVSTASTSRASTAGSTKKSAVRRPRSRMSNAGAASWNPRRDGSTTPAPAPAPASTAAPSARAPKPAGYKKGYAYIAPVAPAASFPRWVPERKGTLPNARGEPQLPPIMDSPWFVPRKKKLLGGGIGGAGGGASVRGGSVGAASAAGSGTGSTGRGGGEGSVEGASDEEDGEEERAKALGRSVALHRPRRGGLDMKPFDVSLLWD